MVQPAAVQIKAGRALIDGDLTIPVKAAGLVVFSHGSGSSRFSRRNRSVAQVLQGWWLCNPAARSADASGRRDRRADARVPL